MTTYDFTWTCPQRLDFVSDSLRLDFGYVPIPYDILIQSRFEYVAYWESDKMKSKVSFKNLSIDTKSACFLLSC